MRCHMTMLAFYSLLIFTVTGNSTRVPNAPMNLNVIDVGPAFIKLVWESDPKDSVEFYKFQYREKGDINGFIEERIHVPAHTVTRLSAFTTYEFQVIAVNAAGDSRPSDIIEKTTKPIAEPAITPPLRNLSVAEEQIVSFVCKASGSPRPTFTWYRDKKRIKDVNRQRYEIIDMPHGSVLRIEPVKNNRDAGQFSCEIDNGNGDKVSTSATLSVYPVEGIPEGYPRIKVNPKLKSVEKGRNATMKCEAEAPGPISPEPIRIEWFKDKVPVDLSDSRLTIVEPGNLEIANSMESDHGRYECVASNSIGVAYSFAAMLYVKVRRVPPHFTQPPQNVEINPYTNVNLTCVAVGSPMPKVKFRDGPIELTPEDEEHIGTNTLILINQTESKNYTCVASSELGKIEHIVEVRIKAPGTPPKNVIAQPLSPVTVLVKWDAPDKPNGVIQGYKIFYTTEADLPITLWTTHEVPVQSTSERQATITELKPNKTYSLCVLAYSAQGEGPISELVHVVTKQGVECYNKPCFGVPGQPRDLHAKVLAPNRIEVDWSPPETFPGVLSYKLYYNDSFHRREAHAVIKPPTNSYVLEDLTPDTVYHIQVSATSINGEGAKSTIIQAKTYTFIPGEPKHVKVQVVNSTTLFVEWKPPVARKRKGIIRGYYVYYITLDENENPQGQEKFYDTKDGSLVEAVITDLEPSTLYRITVAGYTEKGDGARSEERKIKSGPVPSAPCNFFVRLMNEENPQVMMAWQKPKTVPGELKSYKVSWGRKEELMYTKVLDATRDSFIIDELDKGATYQFSVQAVSENGAGNRAVKTLNIPDLGNPPKLQNENQDRDKMFDIFKCYAETCVPGFVACYGFKNDVFNLCKVEYDLCIARCFMPNTATLKH